MDQIMLDRMNAIKAKREARGLNVRFLRADGTPDCFSFGDADRADAFRASLKRRGLVALG